MNETKTVFELGVVEQAGVGTSDVVYFAQDRLAVRLEGPGGIVVAALSRQAARQLFADIQAWTGDEFYDSRERLQEQLEVMTEKRNREAVYATHQLERARAAEATMREVAEELRKWGKYTNETWCFELADRLDPPPVGDDQ